MTPREHMEVLDRCQFWYVVVGGKPANVMLMDTLTIGYYYFKDGAWVNENRLFDYVHGPDRSLRDARPCSRIDALKFLAQRESFDWETCADGILSGDEWDARAKRLAAGD